MEAIHQRSERDSVRVAHRVGSLERADIQLAAEHLKLVIRVGLHDVQLHLW
jgi:hypothetical protein